MSRQNKDNKLDEFRLDLVEANTHKQLWSMKFTKIGFILSVVAAVVFVIILFKYIHLGENDYLLRSFLLKEKNQKFKAYTPEATNWGVPLKSRKTRFAQTPRFLYAPHPNLLHASCVRPI